MALKEKENRLDEILAAYGEILESLSEEEKESELLNEVKDSFVAPLVAREAKRINAEIKKNIEFKEDSFDLKILKIDSILTEEKELKASIKKDTNDLLVLTKQKIESLSDDQVKLLLEEKWITPLSNNMLRLPNYIIQTLEDKIGLLAEKYSVTFSDLEKEISKVSSDLSMQINDLVGSDQDISGLKEFQALLTGKKYD
jgi:type I restriction enzyme M protein